jgi:hypothetical protein
MYIQIFAFIRFCHFCVAHNTRNFALKICMLVGYPLDYVQIFFHIFLKLINIMFGFFKNNEITGAREPKTLHKRLVLLSFSTHVHIREPSFGVGFHGGWILNLSNLQFKHLKQFWKKYYDIGNVFFYSRGKFQTKTYRTLSSEKKWQVKDFCRWILSCEILPFLLSPKYIVFFSENLRNGRERHLLCLGISINFFKASGFETTKAS